MVILFVAVNGRPLGMVLWRLHVDGQEVWSPVTFTLKESRHVREIKALVSMMMSYVPGLRPSASNLQTEVKRVLGKLLLTLFHIMPWFFTKVIF